MTVLSNRDGRIALEFTWSEVALLNNALNEAFEALDGEEMETRLGVTCEEALRLLRELGGIEQK
ncbi:MAG: hypothetical protein PHV28_16350 [Kiritimatiellae bacterium]|nr:hypothetical protein [Kiritimatiellia bacterium]